MTLNKPSADRRRALGERRSALPAGCAATVMLTAAYGGGGTTGTTAEDGFTQVPRRTAR
ncbi:hypothetical protein [Streptomyces sp. NPDC012510]|uniref:hypothetical protein n=1 Tax=Streptomyces sp. NPDC012510 TaxID=3364838 RepID=UPI0036EB3E2B